MDGGVEEGGRAFCVHRVGVPTSNASTRRARTEYALRGGQAGGQWLKWGQFPMVTPMP